MVRVWGMENEGEGVPRKPLPPQTTRRGAVVVVAIVRGGEVR